MADRSPSGADRGSRAQRRWTNSSVLRLLQQLDATDPVVAITQLARQTVLTAIDAGWQGPPFDPLLLADLLKLDAVPRADVPDAQTVPLAGGRTRIEFNPNRPRGRVRYSIAHEIAHTFFPDCAEQVRNRARHEGHGSDAWQLEALCNIGAAEILMPFGSLPSLQPEDLGLEALLGLQRKFDVSTEALFIRIARLMDVACAMFCASRIDTGSNAGRYRLDYMIGSRSWSAPTMRGTMLPVGTALKECTAIGYSAASVEAWDERAGPWRLESVGVPGYPGSRYPRVVGILRPSVSHEQATLLPCVRFVRGSALEPRGEGHRYVVQVVSDKTPNWGGAGFAQAVRSVWPSIQDDFRDWAAHKVGALRLEVA